MKIALSKGHSPVKKDALNLSDGDIEKTENYLEEGNMTKTLPAKRNINKDKDEINEREMYLTEIQHAYEQNKKYCEEAKDLAESLMSAHNEINNCNKLLEIKDNEIELLKKFASKETMNELTVLIKGMTEEIEKLKQENIQLRKNASEALNSKINELEEQIKTLHEDINKLVDDARTKIEEEKQRSTDLSKQLEEVQGKLLDSKLVLF